MMQNDDRDKETPFLPELEDYAACNNLKANENPSFEYSLRGFEYSLREIKTSRQLREAVMAEYPMAFQNSPDSRFYNRMLQYLLQPQFLDDTTKQLVLPARTIATLDGKRYNSNYKAWNRVNDFIQACGLNLLIQEYRYTKGRARTVAPQWPTRIEEALKKEQALAGTKHERVYFENGKVYGRSRQAKEREELKQLVQEANEAVPRLPEQE